MNRRRLISRTVIVLGLAALGCVAANSFAAGPPSSNPGTPFQAILDKLDLVLGAIVSGPDTDAWDKKYPNATRWVALADFNNEAILDRETGLVWDKGATSAGSDWFHAVQICYDKTIGGRKGFRPATVEELTSLLINDYDGVPFPFNPVFSFNWSSSTVAGNTAKAWAVGGLGDAAAYDKTVCCGTGVWCVRGGIGHDGR